MQDSVRNYLASIGQRGGRASKRTLSPEEARLMVKIREARKAYQKFYTQCFWSYDPLLKIQASDISWVAMQLMKQGNRKTWELGRKLCH